MSNVLDDTKQQQILALGRLGWSLRRIEQAVAVRRETISGYLKAAGIAVHGRGRRSESKPKPAITSREVSTDPARAPSATCEPYRDLIAAALARGRNAVAIWHDLVDDHGFPAQYASVRRFVIKLRGTATAEPRVVITTAPGEEGQVDYGVGPMVRDRGTGKYRRTRLFVLTLGCSRKSVRPMWRSSAQIWRSCMSARFVASAAPRDRPRQSERRRPHTRYLRSRAQSAVSRRARALRRRRAPVRVGDPDRKGKVEAGVGHAQKTPLRGLRFESLEAA
jgi:hypothetical protein